MDYKKEWNLLRKRIEFIDDKLARPYTFNCCDTSSIAASLAYRTVLDLMNEAEGLPVKRSCSTGKIEEGFEFYEGTLQETAESIHKALENIHKLKTFIVGSKFMDE